MTSSATATAAPAPQAVHRKDYTLPDFTVERVDLEFELGEEWTTVRARLDVRRNPKGVKGAPLVLDGEGLETVSVKLDGKVLASGEYEMTEEKLTLRRVPDRFELSTVVRIRPQDNKELSGLYKSSGNFCTQCEAQGFRRITWFLDRPDVMARYTTVITADATKYPVLLSNGNRVEEKTLANGLTRVKWEDPWPKPSYLFALVAGNLACHAGTFTTVSGRTVALEIWVEPQNIDKCEHALRSLAKSMAWDEQAFGREYDLDVYMIVAVGDFNMGAMENKGLNIFNSKFVLARPESATDADFEAVEAVIAHEYFHNWTGNRVTCRDWFQLTLKEGLTVYRDQLFTGDMTSHGTKRIDDVRQLRAVQFAEDGGPLSHPIRPESYIAMDNFYTATVYEKGAQVIGMYATLLGKDGFRRGMDLYFERHDGQAVTCDDFRAAMAEANGRDLAQFERWYLQPGTPRLGVSVRRDGADLVVAFEQRAPKNHPKGFEPLHVPVRFAIVGADGQRVPLRTKGVSGGATEAVLELTKLREEFRFASVPAGAVPSILRGFSAPVELEYQQSDAELAFLFGKDDDDFNRWDAGQRLFGKLILECARTGAAAVPTALHLAAFADVLADTRIDGAMKAALLVLPGETTLAQAMDVIDPDALHDARVELRRRLASEHHAQILALYEATRPKGAYQLDQADAQRRELNGVLLAYLSSTGRSDAAGIAWKHFEAADNMTDQQNALGCLVEMDVPERKRALDAFHERWHGDPLVLDKWFMVQATSQMPGAAARVRELTKRPDFTLENPNRARSVVHAFAANNPTGFHDVSGAGYRFVADHVIAIGAFNPQIASRLAKSFNQWKRYDTKRQALMKLELERIAGTSGLSKDVFEVVTMALNG
jgi:aminopeptidase N